MSFNTYLIHPYRCYWYNKFYSQYRAEKASVITSTACMPGESLPRENSHMPVLVPYSMLAYCCRHSTQETENKSLSHAPHRCYLFDFHAIKYSILLHDVMMLKLNAIEVLFYLAECLFYDICT